MKRKLEIAIVVLVLAAGAVVIFLTTGKDPLQKTYPGLSRDEITIRNATDNVITYRVKKTYSGAPPERKRLKSDDIHRYPTEESLDITFSRLGKTEVRSLIPGKPYSFRYDEDNLIQLYEGSHGRPDAVDLAPYLATPMIVVEKMLEMADVDRRDVVYDLGCGDGRIVITAAKKFGARGVGIDIDPKWIKVSREAARKAGVSDRVEFRVEDATRTDISKATVVTLYLLPESNALLLPKFEKQLRPGAYVVSHNYHIPGWEEKEVNFAAVKAEGGKKHSIFLYQK